MEIWKTIPGFSLYEASSTGKLRSKNYKRTGKIKELKPSISGGYYKTMLLADTGKYKSWNVHKFVTITYFGYPDNGMEVNHKDGNKLNNHIDNLEYVTRSENILHAYKTGLETPQHGSKNGNSKLTESDVIQIRDHANNYPGRYYGRKGLAEKYGVSEAHIKDIVNKRRGTWKYV